jgi:hypothetical protein
VSIRDAAEKGHREGLEAMRDKLAEAMDLAEPSVVAQVAARLQAVLKELAEMDAAVPKGSTVDEIAQRRSDRLAKTSEATSSGRRRNVRRA